MLYDVSIHARLFSEIEAENQNEAISIATDKYYEETGDTAYSDDAKIVREYEE